MSHFSYKDCGKIGRLINISPEWTANGVSTDTRSLKAGNLFFALSGDRFNGHAYIKEAVTNKAAAAVVSEAWFEKNKTDYAVEKLIVTQQPLSALQNMAKLHRRRSEASVIAITGTNGKTTCKEMTFAVLSKNFRTTATHGNLNNEIGVPLTLLNIEHDTQAVVVEMGADKKGDISFLCDLAQPDSGVITNIGIAHIQSFGTIDAVAKTKCELFEALSADGVRFVNMDDEHLSPHAKPTKGLVTFGVKNEANFKAEILSLDKHACAKIRIHAPETHTLDIQLNVPGSHQAYNALIAAAIGFSLGVNDTDITSALEHYSQPSNRMGVRRHHGITILDDTYNANPDSMRAALDTLMNVKRNGRAIAVLADMLELGPISADEHAKIGEYVSKKKTDALFTTGVESKIVHEHAKSVSSNLYFEKKNDLLTELKKFIKSGDTVLVKGSRGMKMEDVINALIS